MPQHTLSSRALITAAALLAGASLGHAQNRPEVPSNVAQLSASGTVEVPQDLLSIAMATTREGSDANAVQSQLKTALDAALAEARKAAQPGQLDVRTGHFSLSPRYTKDGKINGWQGSAELVLEGRDFARISSTAGKVQTLTVSGVSFSLSREQRQRVESEAQQLAIERFKAKAGEVAKGFGLSGYTLREINVSSSEPPAYAPRMKVMAMAASASADAPVPVEAGKSSVTVSVSGSVQLK